MIRGVVLLIASHVTSHSIINSHTATVVSLFKSGSEPAHVDWTNHPYPITIKNQSFVCVVGDELADTRQLRLEQFRLRSAWAPLRGYIWEDDSIIEFGKKIEADLRAFFPSEKSTDKHAIWYTHPDHQDHVSLEAVPARHTREKPKNICRPGDAVPDTPGAILAQSFSNGTAKIVSTYSDKPVMKYVPFSSLRGCDSDGVIRIKDFIERQPTDALNTFRFASDIFLAPGDYHSLLSPLGGTCLLGQLHGRQFEYCYPGRFRFLQTRTRVAQNWPEAVNVNVGGIEWNQVGKKLIGEIDTAVDARQVAAFLTDRWEVEVTSERLSYIGIGGSFNPVNPERVFAGVLVFDQNHPSGCTDAAFGSDVIPASGPWIAIVDRGDCMFQEKGLIAQKKGAGGVVVVNQKKREMISAMASVSGKPALDIPMALVDVNAGVKKHVGTFVTMRPFLSEDDKFEPPKPISFSVSFHCNPKWDSEPTFATPCKEGDSVLIHREGEQAAMHATVVAVPNYGLIEVGKGEVLAGHQVSKGSHTPCTAQLGTFIEEVTVDHTRVNVNIHSALLCRDRNFREPQLLNKNVVCAMNKK
jgi:hypothetical protein